MVRASGYEAFNRSSSVAAAAKPQYKCSGTTSDPDPDSEQPNGSIQQSSVVH